MKNKCGYVSNKKLLGETYVIANANGYMGDGVYPNSDGNNKIVTYAKVNGLLEIYLTPNTSTYNMNFYIDGNVKFTYLAVTGQSIFEN
ncbi:hypothetical protein M3612_17880 [Niallia taxi]|uniref:hypothetical protein n=1 Tax=Niallia taxi TaxID=2499688 RepID=UPI00203EF88D|nr:hypothetical protein [Niallia taxi]MCM3216357.1 hypothetical protein [Niallia taxi]